jgi:hypothetical protein
MRIGRKRRGVEAVDPSRDSVEQADSASPEAGAAYDVEHGPTSTAASSIESVTDERSADPFNDERNNVERP